MQAIMQELQEVEAALALNPEDPDEAERLVNRRRTTRCRTPQSRNTAGIAGDKIITCLHLYLCIYLSTFSIFIMHVYIYDY